MSLWKQVNGLKLPKVYLKYTRRYIDTIDSPDDEHEVARNM
jgi:hypothetical protein